MIKSSAVKIHFLNVKSNVQFPAEFILIWNSFVYNDNEWI
jgi:hypothetical protein